MSARWRALLLERRPRKRTTGASGLRAARTAGMSTILILRVSPRGCPSRVVAATSRLPVSGETLVSLPVTTAVEPE